jgi:hypothetical protein
VLLKRPDDCLHRLACRDARFAGVPHLLAGKPELLCENVHRHYQVFRDLPQLLHVQGAGGRDLFEAEHCKLNALHRSTRVARGVAEGPDGFHRLLHGFVRAIHLLVNRHQADGHIADERKLERRLGRERHQVL